MQHAANSQQLENGGSIRKEGPRNNNQPLQQTGLEIVSNECVSTVRENKGLEFVAYPNC